jgi:hypothetical protein
VSHKLRQSRYPRWRGGGAVATIRPGLARNPGMVTLPSMAAVRRARSSRVQECPACRADGSDPAPRRDHQQPCRVQASPAGRHRDADHATGARSCPRARRRQREGIGDSEILIDRLQRLVSWAATARPQLPRLTPRTETSSQMRITGISRRAWPIGHRVYPASEPTAAVKAGCQRLLTPCLAIVASVWLMGEPQDCKM